ncbi:hypothetical protein FQZ97_701130 [compost metagenome]
MDSRLANWGKVSGWLPMPRPRTVSLARCLSLRRLSLPLGRVKRRWALNSWRKLMQARAFSSLEGESASRCPRPIRSRCASACWDVGLPK